MSSQLDDTDDAANAFKVQWERSSNIDENTPLINEEEKTNRTTSSTLSCFRNHKWKLILIVIIVAIAVALVIYFTYSVVTYGAIQLIVFEFNVWGMPGGIGGCKYKKERMAALAELIRKHEPYFDIFLLAELWMEKDHNLLQEAAQDAGLYMTNYRELASSYCDGRVLITDCSGLAIISVYPIVESEFHMYTWRGTIWDGEGLAGKGVGRIQIEHPANLTAGQPSNMTIDLFVTHTIADSGTTKANDTWYRVKQVEELMDSFIKNSKADAVILGGDFNTPPLMDPGQPYEIIQRYMKNSCAEFWAKMEEWLLPKFATYGNARNSFSYTYDPITYDYVFHKSNNANTTIWVNWFGLPLLQTRITQAQKETFITLSDHEPVISTINLKKWK